MLIILSSLSIGRECFKCGNSKLFFIDASFNWQLGLIRKKAGNSFFGKLMDCFYCLSIWIALPFGIWLGTTWIEKILVWVSLSGAACLLEQATTKSNSDNTTTYHED